MKKFNEKQLITWSVWGALIFAIGGIVLGSILNSQMILFDGVYSLISLGLSLLSLWAVTVSKKKDYFRIPLFNNGKNIKIDTAIVLIKYSVIFLIVSVSLFTAFRSLMTGGRDTVLNFALLYSVLSTVLCFGVYALMSRPFSVNSSSLIKAEANQWLMDTWASLGVFLGFVLSFILSLLPGTEFLVPFMDPFMVIIVSIYFIQIPIKEVRKNYLLIKQS